MSNETVFRTLPQIAGISLPGAQMLALDTNGYFINSGITTDSISAAVMVTSGGVVPYTGATSDVNLGNHVVTTDAIKVNTSPVTPSAQAQISWNSTFQTFDMGLNSNITLHAGIQTYMRGYNSTSLAMSAGQTVYINGEVNGIASIALARADVSTQASQVIGIVAETIPASGTGFVTKTGIVYGINTQGYTQGQPIYLGEIPGTFTAQTSGFAFTSHINDVGVVGVVSPISGSIYVNTKTESIVSSLSYTQNNIATGNTMSTGVYNYTGMTIATSASFTIPPLKGFIVENTGVNSTSPILTSVNYNGGTFPVTNILTDIATYVLINKTNTIIQQATYPTPTQRRDNIFLGKIVHTNHTSILTINNTVDYDTSPFSALRDMFTPIAVMNDGVTPYADGANLSFNKTAGSLYGMGINWTTDQKNPNRVDLIGATPVTFAYYLQNAVYNASTTFIDPGFYDNAGVRTAISAGGDAPANRSTNQRVYQFTTGNVIVQYGQQVYNTLALAVAGTQTESFVKFPAIPNGAVLIGIISVRRAATVLNDTTFAIFTPVSILGEATGGTAGISTTTLQQAYNNSSNPEILIDAIHDGFTVRNGTGNADSVTHLFETQNTVGSTTAYMAADGTGHFAYGVVDSISGANGSIVTHDAAGKLLDSGVSTSSLTLLTTTSAISAGLDSRITSNTLVDTQQTNSINTLFSTYANSTTVAAISAGLSSNIIGLSGTYAKIQDLTNLDLDLQSQIVNNVNSVNTLYSTYANSTTLAAISAGLQTQLTNNVVHTTGNETIGGNKTFTNNVIVNGNLNVNGTQFIVNTQTISASDNILVLNAGDVGPGVTRGVAGISVYRGPIQPAYEFVYEEARQAFTIGTTGSTQVVATRQDAPLADGLAQYNATTFKFDTIANTTYPLTTSVTAVSAGLNTRVTANRNDINTLFSTYANSTTVAAISAGLDSRITANSITPINNSINTLFSTYANSTTVAAISAGLNTRATADRNDINTLYSTYANTTSVAAISAGLDSRITSNTAIDSQQTNSINTLFSTYANSATVTAISAGLDSRITAINITPITNSINTLFSTYANSTTVSAISAGLQTQISTNNITPLTNSVNTLYSTYANSTTVAAISGGLDSRITSNAAIDSQQTNSINTLFSTYANSTTVAAISAGLDSRISAVNLTPINNSINTLFSTYANSTTVATISGALVTTSSAMSANALTQANAARVTSEALLTTLAATAALSGQLLPATYNVGTNTYTIKNSIYVQHSNAFIDVSGARDWSLQTVDADGRLRIYDNTGTSERVSIYPGFGTVFAGGISGSGNISVAFASDLTPITNNVNTLFSTYANSTTVAAISAGLQTQINSAVNTTPLVNSINTLFSTYANSTTVATISAGLQSQILSITGGGSDSSKVSKAGDTMTGTLILHGVSSPTISGTQNEAYGANALVNNRSTGIFNTALGYFTLNANTVGRFNTAIGSSALDSNINGDYNTALGTNSATGITSGSGNTAVGYSAMGINSFGNYNTVIGYSALSTNSIGSWNIAIGYNAGQLEHGSNTLYIDNASNTPANTLIYSDITNGIIYNRGYALLTTSTGVVRTEVAAISAGLQTQINSFVSGGSDISKAEVAAISAGLNNTKVDVSGDTMTGPLVLRGVSSPTTSGSGSEGYGASALINNRASGNANTAVGYLALTTNSLGSGNTAIGSSALLNNINGNNNTAIGGTSLQNSRSGNANTAIGEAALGSNTTGGNNTGIGFQAGLLNITGSNNINIGYWAGHFETGSNTLYIDSQNNTAANALIYSDMISGVIYNRGKALLTTSTGVARTEVAAISAGLDSRISLIDTTTLTNSVNTLYSTYANSTTVAAISAGLVTQGFVNTGVISVSTYLTLTRNVSVCRQINTTTPITTQLWANGLLGDLINIRNSSSVANIIDANDIIIEGSQTFVIEAGEGFSFALTYNGTQNEWIAY